MTEAEHAVWGKLKGWAAGLLVICGGLLYMGFGVETSVSMPPYAVVLVDDTSKSFIAPQCVAAWQNGPAKTFGLMRRTTASEAYKLHYEPDYDCVQTGALSQDGPSFSGVLLEKLGILPRKKYWWDMPFRTDDGVIYYPGTTPVAAIRAKAEPDGTPEFCYEGNPRQSNGAIPDLTPSQMDICGQFATRHLKANGTMPTDTADQLIGRWSNENGACSVPVSARKGGPKRAPTQDEVTACVVKTETARLHAEYINHKSNVQGTGSTGQ